MTTEKKTIAVYGASGYTGQLVVAELVRRGHAPVLAGRDRAALQRVAETFQLDSRVAVARADDPGALRAMLEGADAVLNCAGPFSHTAGGVATAAIAVGAHYLDTNAVEQSTAKRLFDDLCGAARDAGVAIVPAMATYGAISDLMAHVVAAPGPVKDVSVAYLVKGWIPTRGSQRTAAEVQVVPRMYFEGGRFAERTAQASFADFDFGTGLGTHKVVENYPGVEVVTIPQHVVTEQVRVMMALSTLQDIRSVDSEWAAGVDAEARAKTEFSVIVDVQHETGRKRKAATGRDIYGLTAPILVAGAEQLLAHSHKVGGVLSPSQAFEPIAFLDALRSHDFEHHDVVA